MCHRVGRKLTQLVAAVAITTAATLAAAQLPYFDSAFHPLADSSYWHFGRMSSRPRNMPTSAGSGTPMQELMAGGLWVGATVELIASDPVGVNNPFPMVNPDAIALDRLGRVYATYRRGHPNHIESKAYFKVRAQGGTWSDEVQLPFDYKRFPHVSITVPPGDTIPHFIFLEGDAYVPTYIQHGMYDWTSETWTVDTVAFTERNYWHNGASYSIASDELGGIHVVWVEPVWNEELQAEIDRVMYAENTTGTWHTQIITDIGYRGEVQVEWDGRAHIKYQVRRDNHNFVIVAVNQFRGGNIWTADSIDTAPVIYNSQDYILGPDGSDNLLLTERLCSQCFVFGVAYTRRDAGETT